MRKITLLFLLLISFFSEAQVISHSTSMTLSNTNVACNGGTPSTSRGNRYFRFFNLSTFSITSDYTISSVEYGVQSIATPTLPLGLPVTIKIYTTTATNFPTGYPAGYTQVATVTTNIVPADATTLKSIPISATIPAGSNVLIEVGYDAQTANSGNLIFLSANDLGESAPTYISSTTCSITAPTTMAAINFPNAHLVLSVTGTTLGLETNKLNQQVSVYPNPTKGQFTLDLPATSLLEKVNLTDVSGKQINLDINAENSFNIATLNSGIYFLSIQTSEGIVNRKLIKE